MKIVRGVILALALSAITLQLGCAASRSGPKRALTAADREPITPEWALENFDAAWRMIYEHHFDPEFNGVDWLALRDELRPKAESAATRGELRNVIRDMLSRLKQSHFSLFPREMLDALAPSGLDDRDAVADVGVELRLLNGQIVVYGVEGDGPAARAGVRPGWLLKSVDGKLVADVLARLTPDVENRLADLRICGLFTRRLNGAVDTDIDVVFLDADDKPVPLTLTRARNSGTPSSIGDNFPTVFVKLHSRRIEQTDPAVSVGLIHFNMWFLPVARPFDQAIDDMRDADGMVVDLRGNGGGVLGLIMGVAGHFLDERVSLGALKTRANELYLTANPRLVNPAGKRVTPYAGPLAILVDAHSGSASELFAGGMQSIGRARIFGQISLGAALPARMESLPNRDVLYHAFADFLDANGTSFEGRGVIPDEPVALSRADLLAGRDAPLEAALRWIAAEKKRQAAAKADKLALPANSSE